MRPTRIALASCAIASTLALAGTVDGADAAPNPVQPQRVLDTRSGLGAAAGPLVPGQVLHLALPTAAAAGATSVVLNLTADQAQAAGYVSAWPCDEAMPATSVLNVVPGRAVANLLAIDLPDSGLCFASSAPLHLIADLSGWFTGTGDVRGITPNRILDTRSPSKPLAAGEERRVKIAGTTGIPGSAAAAALNITVVQPAADGYLLAYPCGTVPTASTVNFRAGEELPNFTFVLLSGGDICVRSSVPTGVIIDSFGYSSNSGGLRTLAPARLLDTRQAGTWPYGVPISTSTPLAVRVAGKAGVPNDASAALLTITVDNAPAGGYVTAWPCDQPQPGTSVLNLFPGALRSNLTLVKLAADGTVCLAVYTANGAPVHIVADAVGSLTGGPQRSAPPADPPPPTPAPNPNPNPGGKFTTLPVGSALPSDAQCAAAVRDAAEVRPQNAAYNAKAWSSTSSNWPRATGSFTGTTDELIQWVACKWGIDEDVVRAQVAKESWWKQTSFGDWGTDPNHCAPGHAIGADGRAGECPESVGLMQVRTWLFEGGELGSVQSSSYNLDVSYAVWRDCFEGKETWLNDVERGKQYAAGDMWGCLGRWFTGRWYTPPAYGYIAAVQDYLNDRVWEEDYFIGDTAP